ncbi:MAG: DNA/RNA non-specific endonuclease [Chitinophagaceae bacterium]|nr:DNA/RNA non-specific endonuclease [Chitinophagaceae bacterium]
MEDYVRNTLLRGNSEAYIATGSYGRGGYNANGLLNTIAGGNITVPAKVWKVVLVMPKGTGDLPASTATPPCLP